MNEVNLKYFVIPKKKITEFLEEFGFFIEEEPIFTKKKIPRYAIGFDLIWVANFSFWITEGIGLTRVCFHF
jgi:hypothetical protein